MFRIILRAGVLALPLMVAACNQTSPVADAALNLGTQFDPTGLSGTAIGMAQSLQPASSEAENDGDSFDLSQIAPRLRDVAAGRTARIS